MAIQVCRGKVDPSIAVTPSVGIFVTVQVVYLLGLAVLAAVSYRKTGTLAEFLVMGRSAGAFLTGTAYFATQFSMSSLVGVPGEIYSIGFAGLGIILSIAMFSMAFGVLVAGRKLQALSGALDLMTLPDYIASRYDSRVARLLCALVIIFFLIPYLAAQLVGAGIIFNVFTGSSYEVGAVLMGVVVIAYCLLGGMRATVLTDALQGMLMVAAAVTTFIAVMVKGGGLERIMSQLAATNPGAMSFPGHP
ncbi:MAG: sodium:solute symporter family transporter, partial [Gammaproteobacteria bacterium]